MSAATSAAPAPEGASPPIPGAAAAPARAGEACPLCGAPLHPTQEWCLNCGAAARTRLAASPNWKGPIAALAATAVLSLGVIAAALVKLAGETGPGRAPITRTLTTAAPAAAAVAPVAPVPTVTAPTAAAPVPALPGAGTGGIGALGTSPAPTQHTATTPQATQPAGTGTVTKGKRPNRLALKRIEQLNLSGALK